MRKSLIRLHWLASAQFGIDPLKFFRAIAESPRYVSDWLRFRKLARPAGLKVKFLPAMHDRRDNAGGLSEYFWQDFTVARLVNAANPPKHVDVGSLLTGFVAYLASSREVEVIDIRPLPFNIPGVTFTQADVLDIPEGMLATTSSLSSLHAVEHFGLGRYGDPLSVDGPYVGIRALCSIVEAGGTFYLSSPMGRERVDFNANWVIDPHRALNAASEAGMSIERFFMIDANGAVESSDIPNDLKKVSLENYTLGLMVLRK